MGLPTRSLAVAAKLRRQIVGGWPVFIQSSQPRPDQTLRQNPNNSISPTGNAKLEASGRRRGQQCSQPQIPPQPTLRAQHYHFSVDAQLEDTRRVLAAP